MKNTRGNVMNSNTSKGSKSEKIINIIVAIILVIVFILTLNILLSAKKGYVELFGSASIAVETDSMKGDKANSFNAGDIIKIKILKTEAEQKALKVGDIITYYDYDIQQGKRVLNSHRIIEVINNTSAGTVSYRTKGDNNIAADFTAVMFSDVIGVYTSKIPNLGKVTLFFRSSTGFLVCVVVPSILIVFYCAFLVYKNIKEKNKKEVEATLTAEEREKIKAELLKELQAEQDKQDK